MDSRMIRVGVELLVAFLVGCEVPRDDAGRLGVGKEAIMGGTKATAYPEAVVVTSSGILPCSGAVIAPRVVLTAGHCRSSTSVYKVSAPNANQQQATGSSEWTTFDGKAATSSDTLLIFLDAPIQLAAYPQIASAPVAPGTAVIEVGRTLDGAINDDAYVSPKVTITGTGDSLGFPFNYQALRDISELGDSGGPVELAAPGPHVIVATIDTDTIEQKINEEEPIDLFARIDLVHDAIEAQIATHGGLDGTGPFADSGGPSDASPGPAASGTSGCGVSAGSPPGLMAWAGIALLLGLARRRLVGRGASCAKTNAPHAAAPRCRPEGLPACGLVAGGEARAGECGRACEVERG